jgi:hypothetical protein
LTYIISPRVERFVFERKSAPVIPTADPVVFWFQVGGLVAFVKLIADGVPRFGVVITQDVVRHTLPLPEVATEEVTVVAEAATGICPAVIPDRPLPPPGQVVNKGLVVAKFDAADMKHWLFPVGATPVITVPLENTAAWYCAGEPLVVTVPLPLTAPPS